MTDVLTTPAPHMPTVGHVGGSEGGVQPDARVPEAQPTAQPEARVQAYADLFDRLESTHEPQWIRSLRRGAIERFRQLGFPTTKNEDWHFTSVAPIVGRAFGVLESARTVVTAEQLAPFLFGDGWDVLVFVNGVFAPSLSAPTLQDENVLLTTLIDGVRTHERVAEQHLAGLGSYQTNAFTALNSAFFQDGLFIHVAPNAKVDRPIHLVHVTTNAAEGALLSPRTLVIADHHSEVTLLESFVALDRGTYFTNAVTEVYLAPGARVRHYKVQREGTSAFHVGSSYAYQQRDSHYESFSYAVGADLSRTNVSTVLDGEGAHATMNGLYLVDGKQVVDHQTRIEHAKENCTSHELYKGVLDGASHGVFNGKVYVRPEAQKTDGKQSNNNLLLSDKARVDTKPQLEIFADDVKCTHGATIGRLDEVALFYLKSRGVAEDTARKLLTYAFAADVLEELTIDSVREKLEALVFDRFEIAR